MDPLAQRLKELDSNTFERLWFHILKDKYSDITPRHVDGSGGDEGLDVYAGELRGKPTIWQCKSFPNGVGKSQRAQINNSLKAALKHFRPRTWILCLSIDMDAKASRWFERLQHSHRSRVSIGLISASDILHELIHRRTIRNHFFPGAAIDPIELKKIVSKSGELNTEELESLTENNLEDFIERLKERDARCNYQIIFDGDIGPPSASRPVTDGLIVSISNGSKTINVLARDREALSSNPPRFQFSLNEAGIKKYKEMVKTGTQQEFLAEEFGSMAMTTDWPVLAPLMNKVDISKARLIISPPIMSKDQERSIKVRFSGNGKSVEYGLMTLRPVRIGTEESEYVCEGDNLPFKMFIVCPKNATPTNRGTIRFSSKIVGCAATKVLKFIDAMATVQPAGEIEIFDLKDEVVCFRSKIELEAGSEEQAYRRFVNDIALIANRFQVELRIPASITQEDIESILLLKAFAQGERVSLNDLSATLVKSDSNKELLPIQLATGRGVFRFAHPRNEKNLKLFGMDIETAPHTIEAECEINNLAGTLDAFQRASIGDGVEISFRPVSPARVALLTDQEWQETAGASHAVISKKN